MTANKKEKSNKGFKLTVLVLFLALVIFGGYLFVKLNKTHELNKEKDLSIANQEEREIAPIDTSDWREYVNKEYGYLLMHPPLLYTREITPDGGYVSFIRFEENQFSQGKGIAIGVRESTLKEEVESIIDEFNQQGGARLQDEAELEFKGRLGRILYYTPVNPNSGENRAVVIINNGRYSYSISTDPSQIREVLAGFSFIE